MTAAGPAAANSASPLERRLGYRFHDRRLLDEALTHRSAAKRRGREGRSNERLEFLGDRVLALAIADALMSTYPEANEGGLSQRHVALVRSETLAEIAEEMELGLLLDMTAGDRGSGTHLQASTLADGLEAVLGALYLDGGFDAAATVIRRIWAQRLEELRTAPRDPKTTLQEWAQQRALGLPAYRIVAREGPSHAPHFTVEVAVGDLGTTMGQGASKRAAEQAAAEAFLVSAFKVEQ